MDYFHCRIHCLYVCREWLNLIPELVYTETCKAGFPLSSNFMYVNGREFYWLYVPKIKQRQCMDALKQTLPDYPGVSQIQNESSGLPYGSPNLPDKSKFGYFFFSKDEKPGEFYIQIKQILRFLVKDGCMFVKFYLILVYVRPF